MTISKRLNEYEPSVKAGPRPFVEATPMLDIRLTVKQAHNDHVRVAWFHENGNGLLESNIEVLLDRLQVDCGFFDGQFTCSTLYYDREGGGDSPQRLYFRCPLCNKRTATLFHYHNHWGCRQSHGLIYQSQYLTQFEKTVQVFILAKEELSRGRPKGVRHATWEAKLQRFGQLKAKVEASPIRLSHNQISKKRIRTVYSRG